jgi:RimJ/RimL family protein N-acetyltransferase
MLKKRDLNDCHALYDLITHPDVFPYVRHKANSYEEFLFLTKQIIEAEERGEVISRTITDEWGTPIGTISLFDIEENAGFLGTWLGKPFHGLGYNNLAKEAFFQEAFYELGIDTVFMRIRKANVRSLRAAEKLPYSVKANETRPLLYRQLNAEVEMFDLYEIPKDHYTFHLKKCPSTQDENHLLEA